MICSLLKSKLRRLLKGIQICLILLVLVNVSILEVYAAQYPGQIGSGGLDITLTPNATGYGQMYIEWKSQGYNYFDKYFRVFRRSEGGEYETVQIDYTQVTSVRCLQIYPIQAAAGQMKSWVVNTGYGKGIIQVDSVSIDQFNKNPQGYLQDSQGNWKYDVLFFGTWDSNNGKDLTSQSSSWTRKFIEAGRGVIFGHDTIDRNKACYHPNFSALDYYAGVQARDVKQFTAQQRVKVVKTGLFTTYPNYLGTSGYIMNIPAQHTVQQVLTNGTAWLEFLDGGGQVQIDGINCPMYLVTYNNCAMIQTGHSGGQATQDEQKILQNLIFYCNQLIFSQYYTNDYQAQDYAAPNKPTITLGPGRIYDVFAKDNGSTYYYYVESYGKNNVNLNDVLDRSPERSHNVTTGVAKYIYTFDNNPNTVVSSQSQQGVMVQVNGKIPEIKGYDYIHVAAVDGAGNIGPTEHARVQIQIVYNSNNGKSEQMFDAIPNQQYIYTMLNNKFVNDGYRFLTWNTKQDGTGTSYRQGETINIYDDLEVWAIWQKVWVLQIDPNGGRWYDGDSLTLAHGYGDTQVIDLEPTYKWYDKRVQFRMQVLDKKKISDAIRNGYNFVGWKFEQ